MRNWLSTPDHHRQLPADTSGTIKRVNHIGGPSGRHDELYDDVLSASPTVRAPFTFDPPSATPQAQQ